MPLKVLEARDTGAKLRPRAPSGKPHNPSGLLFQRPLEVGFRVLDLGFRVWGFRSRFGYAKRKSLEPWGHVSWSE